MQFRGTIDATLARLYLPLRAAAGAIAGELNLDGVRLYVRANDISTTLLRILTSADFNVPNGVPQLGADGLVPSSLLPTTGSGGGGSTANIVGEVKLWTGAPFAIPSGWLVCDGSELTQSNYASLFSVMGHRFGVPSDYATKFRLPDFVGRCPLGALGQNDGSAGKVHKINIVNPGIGYNAGGSGTFAVTLFGSGATVTIAPTATITVTSGAITRIDIDTGGNVAVNAVPTQAGAGKSNCDLCIPSFGVGGTMFEYEVMLAPLANTSMAWGTRLTDRGAGYTSAPKVTITGGGVTGATAVAVLDGDAVREIVITNPGTGTPAGATVSFSGGGPPTRTAAAGIVFYDAPVTVGDIGGEAAHKFIPREAPDQALIDRVQDGGGGPMGPTPAANALGDTARATGHSHGYGGVDGYWTYEAGAGQPAPARPPYVGVLYIVYAGA